MFEMSQTLHNNTQSARATAWTPKAVQPTPRSVARSLRQHQQFLTQQLWSSLAADPDASLAAAQQILLTGVDQLTASQDWVQLQHAFRLTASQHNSTQHTSTAQARQASPSSTRQPSSGSSPWGFALRQPARQPQQSTAPAAAAGASTLRALFSQQQQQLLPQPWKWQEVQGYTVLGLGSIGALRPAAAASQHSAGPPPPRLGFRLFQLVLAVALHKTLLPGLRGPPQAFDPEFDQFDFDLLTSLGFQVADRQPGLAVDGKTLMYMPCCPRQLFSDVLAANWQQLEQLAIFGTSMSSLADSQALFTALTGSGDGPGPDRTGCGSTPADSSSCTDTAAAAAATAAARGRSGAHVAPVGGKSSSSSSLDVSMQQQQLWQGQLKTTGAKMGGDTVGLAYQQGRVIEVACPDCSAHGVGVSLHLFRPLQQ